MTKEKQIKKYIDKSIKSKKEIVDETELQQIFDLMTTEEIESFWNSYSSSKAYLESNISIPHWKTKDQYLEFQYLISTYKFKGYAKDANGKFVCSRTDLINHVKMHLIKIIDEKIQEENKYRNKSLLEKIPDYILIFSYILIPFFIAASIFQFYPIGAIISTVCIIIYLLNIILYKTFKLIVRYRNKRKKQPK